MLIFSVLSQFYQIIPEGNPAIICPVDFRDVIMKSTIVSMKENLHQLRLVVYPFTNKALYIPGG